MTYYCNDRQLLPCPFCSGEPKLTARTTRKGTMAFVSCSFCRAQGQPFTVQGQFYGDDDDWRDVAFTNASRAWQRRQAWEGGNNIDKG